MAKEETKRTTVYIEQDIHRALKLKAVEIERSVSDLVNDALRLNLREDADDLNAFEERAREKSIPFEVAVKKLRARGKL